MNNLTTAYLKVQNELVVGFRCPDKVVISKKKSITLQNFRDESGKGYILVM